MQGESKKRATKFDDLHIFQRARVLVRRIYALTRNRAFARDPVLAQQLRRAAVSVLSNIAEGFERGSNAEFAQSLFISKGSCGEVRAQAIVALDQGYLNEAEHRELSNDCQQLSAMLANLITHLKRSPFRSRTPIKTSHSNRAT